MLIDFEYKNKNLIVSYVNDNKNISMKNYQWKNTYDWIECEKNDPDADLIYKTWDGMPVKLEWVPRPSKHSISYFLDNLPQDEKDEIFGIKRPKVYFIDIETEVTDSFESPTTARNKIQSIAIVCESKVLVLAIKELTEEEQHWVIQETNDYVKSLGEVFNIKFKFFASEYDMMYYFITKLVRDMPIITGWNFTYYDWQYMMHRANLHLGIDITATSPTGKMSRLEDTFIMPCHRVVVDYMELTKKWGAHLVRESAKLDWVAEQTLKVKKVHYEGDLNQLYANEYPKFIHYNIVDTLLVYFIDKRNKYIDMMLAISDLAHVRMADALGTVSPTEGILRIPLKNERNIVFVNKPKVSFEVEGGYVKEPIPGMKKDLIVEDFTSLYPFLIMQFNLTPESYLGIYNKNTNMIEYKGNRIKYDKNIHILTVFGTVFKNENSTTRNVFRTVYNDRKKNQNLMKEYKNKAKIVSGEIQELEKLLLQF